MGSNSPNTNQKHQNNRDYLPHTHHSPDYLNEHLNGIYERAVASGRFKSNISEYCRHIFGDQHHRKYRRKLSPHWYASTLEEELVKKTPQHENLIIQLKIDTYIQKVLNRKKKGRWIKDEDEASSDPIGMGTGEAT